jgi:hypothetical protein
MHRSNESIAALAAALATAHMALTNPEKSLTGNLPASQPNEPGPSDSYLLDLNNLAEEIEDMGRDEIRGLCT